MSKTVIATIAWRSLHPTHVFCLIQLLSRPGLLWGPVVGDALVERSRGRAATGFLLYAPPEADVLVSIDTDIEFNPDDVETIADQARETKGIVGGVYMTRGRAGGIPTSTLLRDHRYLFDIGDPREAALQPIRYVAGGFMAVHRSVFETLAADLPLTHRGTAIEHYPFYLPFVVEGEDGPELLSEDYALCERAARAGFPIAVNTRVRLGHVGEETFRLEEMLRDHDAPTQPLALTRTGGQGYRIEKGEEG